MQKDAAAIPGLDWGMIKDRFIRHGIPASAVGAGVAGLAHFLSVSAQAKKEKESQNPKDTIVVEVPRKVASQDRSPSMGQYFWDAPLAVGTALVGGATGYAVVDNLLKKYRQKQMDKELQSLKGQYGEYLSRDLAKTAKAESDLPFLDGLLLGLTENIAAQEVEPHRKTAAQNLIKKASSPETLGTMLTSLPGVAALVSGIMAHNYYYNRKKDVQRGIEKEEAEKMKKAPRYIKVVSTPAPSEQEKAKELDMGEAGNEEIPVDDLIGKRADLTETIPLLGSLLGVKRDQPSSLEVQKELRENRREQPVVDEKDIQQIDPNTMMLMTDSGDVQVDALDPEALAALEKHKERILRSLAIGMNRHAA